jgi:hypothetical protein
LIGPYHHTHTSHLSPVQCYDRNILQAPPFKGPTPHHKPLSICGYGLSSSLIMVQGLGELQPGYKACVLITPAYWDFMTRRCCPDNRLSLTTDAYSPTLASKTPDDGQCKNISTYLLLYQISRTYLWPGQIPHQCHSGVQGGAALRYMWL